MALINRDFKLKCSWLGLRNELWKYTRSGRLDSLKLVTTYQKDQAVLQNEVI